MQIATNVVLEKQTFIIHSIAQGLLSIALLIIGFTALFRETIGCLITSALNFLGIEAEYSASIHTIEVSFLDGNMINFSIQKGFSGFLTMIIFTIIFVSTIGIMREKLLKKLLWLLTGIIVCIIWNVNRFVLSISMASIFGLPLFSIIHYLLGPIIDILLIVSLWSLALSHISREERT